MPWLYIVKCSDGSYYTGTTSELEKRLSEHQAGIPGAYTFDKRPVEFVFTEGFSSWPEAVAREMQVKGWSRNKKEALIQGDWERLKNLAKGKSK